MARKRRGKLRSEVAVFADEGVRLPVPLLDLEGARAYGIALEGEDGRLYPAERAVAEGVPEGVRLVLGEVELPLEAVDYRLERAAELLGAGEAEGTLRHPAQSFTLPLGAEEDPLPWLLRAERLGKAFRRLRRESEGGEGEAGWPKPGMHASLEEDGRRLLLEVRVPTPLVPFFLRFLEGVKEPKELPQVRRGTFVALRERERFLLGRALRRDGGEVRVEAEGGYRIAPAGDLLPLPQGTKVWYWGVGASRKEAFSGGYDHLLYRLERDLGFKEPRITTFYAPFQLEAWDREGRMVYFRERGGSASLSLGLDDETSVDQALLEGRYVRAEWPGEWFEQGDHEDTFRVVAELYRRALGILEARLGKGGWEGFRALPTGFLLLREEGEGLEERPLERGVVGLYREGRLVGVRVEAEAF